MSEYLRIAWNEIYRIASTDTKTTYIIVAVTALTVGLMCLKGNIIKR